MYDEDENGNPYVRVGGWDKLRVALSIGEYEFGDGYYRDLIITNTERDESVSISVRGDEGDIVLYLIEAILEANRIGKV